VNDHLMQSAKRGDETAWRRLYEATAPAVRGYFRARQVSDPDDLVGQVFLDAARRIGFFKGNEGGFRAWVFTIAHSRWVDEVRRQERLSTTSLYETMDIPADIDVEAEVVAHLRHDDLLGVVDELPPAQRTAVLLRVLGGLSHAEIAEVTGKSITAGKVNYHRGIRTLRTSLSEESSHGAPVETMAM
jgi:RNA polymerase sigma-70 factor (ECF subfamily)